MSEQWRAIDWVDAHGRYYEVSDEGRVRRRGGKVLKPWAHTSGHLYVGFGRGIPRQQVHRLVLIAFVGWPPQEGCECCHIDGVATNNRAGNLRWGTRGENITDYIRHNGKHFRAKLTAEQVREIRAAPKRHGVGAEFARRFGVTEAVVSSVRSGKVYRWVA